MFGVTISLNEKSVEENIDYLKEMKNLGASKVFTSLRIPEEDPKTIQVNLHEISKYLSKNFEEFIVDVSPRTFDNYSINFIKESGITGLRIDNGVSVEDIVKLSHSFKIIFNASTITKEFLDSLRQLGFQDDVVAWHNYYPKQYSGLDEFAFSKQNDFLKSMNVRVGAYIPGNLVARGTIYEWLPTLENHRFRDPFYCYLDMKYNYELNEIIIGDYGLSESSKNKFHCFFQEAAIELSLLNCKDFRILSRKFRNRIDICRDAIRSVELKKDSIEVFTPNNNNKVREKGSVTIDNNYYGRYMGELQIILNELPSDSRVNIVGEICEDDLVYLDFIKYNRLNYMFTKK